MSKTIIWYIWFKLLLNVKAGVADSTQLVEHWSKIYQAIGFVACNVEKLV